ncbi:MAG: DedA family protein [Mycobacteriaceae bacterium]|nr:DedA family protein [Mycobacteriaceae bacterium]
MHGLLERILNVPPLWIYLLVGLLVFAEDAIFVGFVIPGETAAVLGGVAASQDHLNLWTMMVLVVAAAIIGDSVGYEVGRKIGPRLLRMSLLDSRRHKLDNARAFLARRGGWAVVLGRFTAFFRAVMPALAGIAEMPYRRFLAFNALGGVIWGTGFVLLGYLAGRSYEHVAKTAGRGIAIAVAVIVVVALLVWKIRERRHDAAEERLDTHEPLPE